MIEKYITILKELNIKIGLGEDLSTGLAETVAALSLLVLSIGIFFSSYLTPTTFGLKVNVPIIYLVLCEIRHYVMFIIDEHIPDGGA